MTNQQLELNKYKEKVNKQLSGLIPLLQKAAMGDFNFKIKIPKEENEFTELLVALDLMVDDLRVARQDLEQKVSDRTSELEKKVTEAENINKLMVGRELKMVELKKEIIKLNDRLKLNK